MVTYSMTNPLLLLWMDVRADAGFPFSAMNPSESGGTSQHGTCRVCQQILTSRTFFYGGLVCNCCKAFFWRAHQKTKSPVFHCYKGGQCSVNVQTRRACGACRYQRCLQAGMDPNLILNEDQKKARFKQWHAKKDSKLQLLRASLERGPSSSSAAAGSSDPLPEALALDSQGTSGSGGTKLDYIFTSYNLATTSERKASILSFLRRFAPKTRKTWSSMQIIQEIMAFWTRWARQFRHFATLQIEFCLVQLNVKTRILSSSMPIYINYKFMQLLSRLSEAHQETGQALKMNWFNRWTKLWRGDTNLAILDDLLQQFMEFPCVRDSQSEAIMTFCILLFSLSGLNIQEYLGKLGVVVTGQIQQQMTIIRQFAEYSNAHLNRALVGYHGNDIRMDGNWFMAYSQDEENCLVKEVMDFDQEFSKVSLGEFMVEELLMFTLDVPLSKRFFPMSLIIFRERLTRILCSNPEFRMLDSSEKRSLIANNVNLAMVLVGIKVEASSTFEEQLALFLGREDTTRWSSIHSTRSSTKMNNLLTMRRASSEKSLDFTEPHIQWYQRVVDQVKGLLNDDLTFKILVTLVLLTRRSDHAPPESPGFRPLLLRRLHHCGQSLDLDELDSYLNQVNQVIVKRVEGTADDQTDT